jgi:RNA polymerase sigma-70 factor, ECF subfamily
MALTGRPAEQDAGAAEFRPLVLEVLRIEDGQVAEITDFDLPGLFAAFDLPPVL